MKRALLKAVFVISVATLWLVLMIPLMVAMEFVFREHRGPDRLYSSGDRMMVNMIPMFLCGLLANRAMSRLFHAAGWSDERMSLFSKGR